MNSVEWLDVAAVDDIPTDEVIGVQVGAPVRTSNMPWCSGHSIS